MRTQPTLYVGRLRPYHQYEVYSENGYNRHAQEVPTYYCDHGPIFHVGTSATESRDEPPLACTQETTLEFVFKLSNREVQSVLHPIGTKTSHGRRQVMTTFVLVLHVLP